MQSSNKSCVWLLLSTKNKQKTKTVPLVELRFEFVKKLNQTLLGSGNSGAIALVDQRHVGKVGSLASLLGICKGLIFEYAKNKYINDGLSETAGGASSFELKLNRPKAGKFALSGKCDVDGR